MDLREKLIERRELRKRELDAKHEWEDLKEQREILDAQIHEYMDHHRIEGMKVDGTNFVPVTQIYAQVQHEDAFIAWAKENEPSLVVEKPRKGEVDELVREKLDNGEPLPPGLGLSPKNTISQRAA